MMPRRFLPSKTETMLLASAVPERDGFVLLVLKSPLLMTGLPGAVVSTVTAAEVDVAEMFPAESFDLDVKTWVDEDSTVEGKKIHVPSDPVVTDPIALVPSYTKTRL